MSSSTRTLVCSVLFLDIVEYTKQPVAEQSQLKHSFNALLGEALERVRQKDRILLDTGDGAAVAFLGDPQEALLTAVKMRDEQATIPLRQGINLGPVQLIKDLNGRLNIIGHGINSAQRVMDFAETGQILVSRPFYEVVSCLSADHAGVFRYEGSRADKHVRDHELYSVVSGDAVAERLAASTGHLRSRPSLRHWLAAAGPFGFHRAALLIAPLMFLALAGTGVALRAKPADRPGTTVSVPFKAAAPAIAGTTPSLAGEPPLKQPAQSPAGKPQPRPPAPRPVAAPEVRHSVPPPVTRTAREAPAAAAQPAARASAPAGALGQIRLAISPWGEVYVDGKPRGFSPPLQIVKLPPGPHTVEIRNAALPPRVEKIEVRSGEQTEIRHSF
ncbi:MAG: PEGA domain-containing protein [Betaproteobacteria bacterium]|nr:PEGA domain-containing protein [Betaproteobacteria bacterium]